MTILRHVFRLENPAVPESGQRSVELFQIVSVDEKIQIHGLPRSSEHTEGKTTDGGVSDLVTGQLRDERLENELEIHGPL